MIVISIITEMVFENDRDFLFYLQTPEVEAITSFGKELRTAYDTGEPVIAKTPRPQVGAVTRSEVSVRRLVDNDKTAV